MSSATYLSSLAAELDELMQRIARLGEFMKSGAYRALPEAERGLLCDQIATMDHLHAVLSLRLNRGLRALQDGAV